MAKKKAKAEKAVEVDIEVESPDEIDIFAETDLSEKDSQEEDPEVVVEAPKNVGGRLVGHHPITKEPVYK